MKKSVALALGLVLGACAGPTLDEGLAAIHGKHIRTAYRYLGYPDAVQEFTGDKVYVWHVNAALPSVQPVTTFHQGTVNGQGYYSGTSTSYVGGTTNYQCTLKLSTDEKDRIVSRSYQGSIGGCSMFAAALSGAVKK